MTDVNWLFLDAPHNQNLKYAICFQPNDEILSQEQKNLIPKSHLTDDVMCHVTIAELGVFVAVISSLG